MTRAATPALKVVDNARPAAPGSAAALRRQQRLTRALARAMAREQALEERLREARLQTTAAMGPWSAGRRVSRDQALEHLVSTGFLAPRKVWDDK